MRAQGTEVPMLCVEGGAGVGGDEKPSAMAGRFKAGPVLMTREFVMRFYDRPSSTNSGAAKKLTVGIGGKELQLDMPGSGWAT